MERYWCLRWLQQQGIDQCNATVLKEDLVRFSHAPLVTRVLGLPELDRGQQIQLKIMGFDELGLELDCTMIASIEPESVESGEAAQIQSDSPDTTASTETEN
jgi:exoribonuclease-2